MRQSQVYQRFLKGSLLEHHDLAREWFGARGASLLARWFDGEFAKIDDPTYRRVFTDHVNLPGVAPDDYAHRVVETPHGALLGGIRFYGRDVTRPFVEVVAHDFEDLDALRGCVYREWSAFGTRFARLRVRSGSLAGPRIVLDHGVHLARYLDMPPPDDRVSLVPFTDVDDAVALINRRYERMAADHPALGRNVAPASPDDVRDWHSAGRLQAIVVCDRVVGLFVALPGHVGWIEGDEVHEEVVDVRYAGHGYAASAQRAWAARCTEDGDGNRLLIGTIDRHNHASRRTAKRAGRPAVLDDVFLLLP